MTVPMNNWCETCGEACHDHPIICSVCGDTLTAPPNNHNNDHDNVPSAADTAALRGILQDMRRASSELNDVLEGLRGQVRSLDAMTRNILQHQQEHWQDIPPELLQQPSETHMGRPTSQKALAQIPRIVLEDKSTLFRQATLQIMTTTSANAKADSNNPTVLRISALVGEFGPVGEHHYQGSSLIVASPLTGKGGLSEETIQEILEALLPKVESDAATSDDNAASNNNNKTKVILYLQRGDGLTFVQKALLAQKAGASAVVIGNNTSFPWPYIMKDSKQEAETHGLSIPVVMVKEEDGKKIVKYQKEQEGTMSCNLHITAQSHDCVVCCERLQNTETVVQLPGCAHIFHEECAMAWLKSHNTCPYCRRELPTDDEDYERERRRQQRTHAGSGAAASGTSEWSEYYG